MKDFIRSRAYLLITEEINKSFIAVQPFDAARIDNSANHDAQLSKFIKIKFIQKKSYNLSDLLKYFKV